MWARVCSQGEQWKKTTLTTALLYPGVVFAIFFACNLLVWGQKSSGAGANSEETLASGLGACCYLRASAPAKFTLSAACLRTACCQAKAPFIYEILQCSLRNFAMLQHAVMCMLCRLSAGDKHLWCACAVPFGTLIALFMLWFGISVPLVFVGSYFGYKKPAPDDPVRTNKIPRQIPEQARCLRCSCPMRMQLEGR